TPFLERHGVQHNTGRFDALNLSPRVNYTLGPGDVLTSQSFVNVNRFVGDTGERVSTAFGPPPLFSGTQVDIDSRAELLRTDLNWTRKLDKGVKLDIKAGVNYNHRQTTAPSEQYFADGTLAL